MNLRELTRDDLPNLAFVAQEDGAARLDVSLTCSECGAFQAADSDASVETTTMPQLAVRLFNQVGWRVGDDGRILCPSCVERADERA